MKRMIPVLIFILIFPGCSSVATSTAAFIVAKHSEKIERNSRRYSGINPCFLKHKPEPFAAAEAIVNGARISNEYAIILNPENDDIDPPMPSHVAYALYVIADRIGDLRAEGKKEWLKKYLDEQEANRINNFVIIKYLDSYMMKCFAVPEQYKKKVWARDMLE